MTNAKAYPLKYAKRRSIARDGPILAAGCVAGRVLRYSHEPEHSITRINFIEVTIDKLGAADTTFESSAVIIRGKA